MSRICWHWVPGPARGRSASFSAIKSCNHHDLSCRLLLRGCRRNPRQSSQFFSCHRKVRQLLSKFRTWARIPTCQSLRNVLPRHACRYSCPNTLCTSICKSCWQVVESEPHCTQVCISRLKKPQRGHANTRKRSSFCWSVAQINE